MTTPPGPNPPGPPPSPPPWPHCGAGAGAGDPVGCRGRSVDPHPRCLVHLAPSDQAAYFAGLTPGAAVDHRGTVFDAALLTTLLSDLYDPATAHPRLGNARFDSATFTGDALFYRVTFAGDARFGNATFTGDAEFDSARFSGDAEFDCVAFEGDARFGNAEFSGDAEFDRATFTADALFYRVTFTGDAGFDGATFTGGASFHRATVTGDARFGDATFSGATELGPLVCGGTVDLSGAVFGVPVTVEVAAAALVCRRTRWEQTATLRLRHAEVHLTGAVLGGRGAAVRIASLRGVDAAFLALTGTGLTRCRFAGAFHLDQLRLDGRTVFALPPTGTRWRRGVPQRWTARRTLAEEHTWRAAEHPPANPVAPTAAEWTPGPDHPNPRLTPGPHDVAPLYRALRKAFEDGKNEPDAADFYYGEMEMRRHDRDRPRAERSLLTGYWALSGYGLRASRALAWLVTTMTATVVMLMLWGLPATDPKPVTAGPITANTQAVPPGQQVRLVTDTPDPALDTAYADRLTKARGEKAGRVVLNSVVFRSSGQNLTRTGTYTEMLSRFFEPVLLALAVLAIRGRVKR